MEIGKHCIWGLLEIKNMKGIFSRQISDSPPAQGAPELISGLTRLCVYLFLSIFLSSIILKSTPLHPQKQLTPLHPQKQLTPLHPKKQAECPLTNREVLRGRGWTSQCGMTTT